MDAVSGLLGGGLVAAIATQLYARGSANRMQARDDAALLLALLTKHGQDWGGEEGKNVPVDGYQAAGRVLSNPQASPVARAAAGWERQVLGPRRNKRSRNGCGRMRAVTGDCGSYRCA